VNGAIGTSDMEGKVARVSDEGVGKRTSFNGADGISDIEGKAARVAASERSRGDASDIDGQTERLKWAGAHEATRATSEFQILMARLDS
jgi:hypothetical protein